MAILANLAKIYGKNDNFATIANRAKHKAVRGSTKVGDTGKFGKYGENDNFATIANRAKHKAMRGPIKVGDTGEFGKYGENDNFATIAKMFQLIGSCFNFVPPGRVTAV